MRGVNFFFQYISRSQPEIARSDPIQNWERPARFDTNWKRDATAECGCAQVRQAAGRWRRDADAGRRRRRRLGRAARYFRRPVERRPRRPAALEKRALLKTSKAASPPLHPPPGSATCENSVKQPGTALRNTLGPPSDGRG